jgi:rare lipoprotein A
MAYMSMRGLVSVVVVTVMLAGCDGTGKLAGPKSTGAEAARAEPARKTGRHLDKDIESPDVFSANEPALWDGRPSLGGVWVASPDVTTPERVLMTNPKNGKTVTGALFRRERENPGPKLQLSSDAAAALGLLAGEPGTISVVALRREEVPVAEPEADVAPEAVAAADGAEPAADGAADKAAVKTDEIGAAAVAAIGKGDPQAETAAEPVTAEGAAEAAPVAQPKKPGFFGRLFKPAAPKGAKPADAAVGEPLSAINPDQAAKTPAVAVEALPDAPAAAGGKTYKIMIGAFGVEANATAAAAKLEQAGFKATVTPGKSGEKPIWSVVAGKAGEKAALLAEVKGLGYADAYVQK